MSKIVKVEVPDIGDFTDVDIIEVLVAAGDQIAAEDALITLESDKATIEIPSPQAGTVKEVLVKVNDKVSQGDVILTMELSGTETAAETQGEEASVDDETQKRRTIDAILSRSELSLELQPMDDKEETPAPKDDPPHEKAVFKLPDD